MKNFFTFLPLLLFFVIGTTHAAGCPRIVSQAPYLTKSLQWLGLESCIVGVSRYDTLDRPHTGGLLDPDLDAIMVLQPDLLITSNWGGSENETQLAPQATETLRLDGFGSMAEVEENLRLIGNAAQISDIEQRVAQFHQQWLTAAQAIDGGGRRVLLLSSCSGAAYSFGRERWLGDLFNKAGFVVVESEAKVRPVHPGAEIATLNALIDQLQPDLLFIFEQSHNPQCALIKPKRPLRIITLDGEKFLHPAPVLLDGLKELHERRHEWTRNRTTP